MPREADSLFWYKFFKKNPFVYVVYYEDGSIDELMAICLSQKRARERMKEIAKRWKYNVRHFEIYKMEVEI